MLWSTQLKTETKCWHTELWNKQVVNTIKQLSLIQITKTCTISKVQISHSTTLKLLKFKMQEVKITNSLPLTKKCCKIENIIKACQGLLFPNDKENLIRRAALNWAVLSTFHHQSSWTPMCWKVNWPRSISSWDMLVVYIRRELHLLQNRNLQAGTEAWWVLLLSMDRLVVQFWRITLNKERNSISIIKLTAITPKSSPRMASTCSIDQLQWLKCYDQWVYQNI